MRTIGILGGMSWESSLVYYRRLNEIVQETVGGVSSASIVMRSYDFARIETLQHEGRWDELGQILVESGRDLKDAGAQILVIATNTMHILADEVEHGSGLPVIHIADAVSDRLVRLGHRKTMLLGTRFTMEEPFYRDRISNRSGAETVVPAVRDREKIHRIIYEELCRGVLDMQSRDEVLAIIDRNARDGVESVVLGCTELPLLIKDGDASVPIVDSMDLHIQAIARSALR